MSGPNSRKHPDGFHTFRDDHDTSFKAVMVDAWYQGKAARWQTVQGEWGEGDCLGTVRKGHYPVRMLSVSEVDVRCGHPHDKLIPMRDLKHIELREQ